MAELSEILERLARIEGKMDRLDGKIEARHSDSMEVVRGHSDSLEILVNHLVPPRSVTG